MRGLKRHGSARIITAVNAPPLTVVVAWAAVLQARGSGWLHGYVSRAPHDAGLLAALRSRAGDAAFEQAWTRGCSLAGARAVQYALEQAPSADSG